MENVFWVIAGKLAGRPGPDRIPWNLAAMRDAGIGAILSVNDGLLCHPEDFEACGIAYACIPLSENAPPQPDDDETCLRALPLAHACSGPPLHRLVHVVVDLHVRLHGNRPRHPPQAVKKTAEG